MRIGIDTLFLDGRPSSLANFVRELTTHLGQATGSDDYVVFATRRVQRLLGGLSGPRVQFVTCAVGNEAMIPRILYQQSWLPVLVHRHRIDVMCCLADVAPLAVRVPVVLKVNTLHHYTTPAALGQWRRWYRTAMIRASARMAALIVANSRANAADIERYLRVPPERIRLVYEAVDEAFTPREKAAELWDRLSSKFAVSLPYILFVSALYPYKNVDIAIRALALLHEQYHWPGSLIVAGADLFGTQATSQALGQRLGIHEKLRFLGPVPQGDLPDLYSGASVFVYPSASETFGKPVVEAMRCATPIVASNAGSIPEVAQDAAILVDPSDAPGMAQAIHEVLTDHALRERLVAAGLRRSRDFSWGTVADGFRAALREATR